MAYNAHNLILLLVFLVAVEAHSTVQPQQWRDDKSYMINQTQAIQSHTGNKSTTPSSSADSTDNAFKYANHIRYLSSLIHRFSYHLEMQKDAIKRQETAIIKLQDDKSALERKSDQNKRYIDQLIAQTSELKSKLNAEQSSMEQLKLCAPRNCLTLAKRTQQVGASHVPGSGSISLPSQDEPLAAGIWTVVQRRVDGSVNFYRNWSDYQIGFGNNQTEFFIGLETLHHLTSAKEHELHIRLTDFANETRFAQYNQFLVGNAQEQYQLKSLGNYSGNAGNALIYNLHQKFSTYDRDNDYDDDNCAEDMHSAWWYRACGASDLNGVYVKQNVTDYHADKGILWAGSDWHDWEYSFKSVTMMIRPK
ncbi:fibrinogen-like protein A [Drosophila montana]|uniref:fibrinogen-like protein A n=1 Tax=Drosophila montana TaxID=40370 RepID=UPI00313ABB0A